MAEISSAERKLFDYLVNQLSMERSVHAGLEYYATSLISEGEYRLKLCLEPGHLTGWVGPINASSGLFHPDELFKAILDPTKVNESGVIVPIMVWVHLQYAANPDIITDLRRLDKVLGGAYAQAVRQAIEIQMKSLIFTRSLWTAGT